MTTLSYAVLTAALAVTLTACKTAEQGVTTVTERLNIMHDTMRVTDTLRVRDIMTDSVRYIMTERIKYRDRIVCKHDTLRTHETRTIVEKEKGGSAQLWILIVILSICLAFTCRR